MAGKNNVILNTVSVPESFSSVFQNAQEYVEAYFKNRKENPEEGLISLSGERYILVRAASMSNEFFDLVQMLYQDRGEEEARKFAYNFLYDLAHAIGKADAKVFFSKINVTDPIERLSVGPIHFAFTGWASVKIFPESILAANDSYYLAYEHPFSFEADSWVKKGEKTEFSVCAMNAGYSSGWCEESFGLSLVAAEVECRAKGDKHCRFLMAPPSNIKQHVDQYITSHNINIINPGAVDVPEFFRRKRLEDELRKYRNQLEDLVVERTSKLLQTNKQLNSEIADRKQAEQALQKSQTMLQAIFDQTFQFIAILKLDGTLVKVNKTAMSLIRLEEDEFLGKPFWKTPWWDNSGKEQRRLRDAINKAAHGQLVRFETKLKAFEGQTINVDFSIKPVKDEKGRIKLLISEGHNITELKQSSENLRQREIEIKAQSDNLQEANIALKVVLTQMQKEKSEEKENVLANVKQSVIPHLMGLRKTGLTAAQEFFVERLESDLARITSPLINKLSSSYFKLTPMEIRIANLVKDGFTNKETTEELGISPNTVSAHRHKIRTKLGLKRKGINLRSYLLSLDN